MSEEWVAFKGSLSGDARIGRVEKTTPKTLSVAEVTWSGEISSRLSRKFPDDILGRYTSREAAKKAVDHAKRMHDQHKEKVDQARSVYVQAQQNQRNAFLAAFK